MEVRGQTLGEEDGKGPLICSRFLGEAKFKALGRQADRNEKQTTSGKIVEIRYNHQH